MKQSVRKNTIVALLVAFAMCLSVAFTFSFVGKVNADAANPYATVVAATSTPVTKEGKTAYKIDLEGGSISRRTFRWTCTT